MAPIRVHPSNAIATGPKKTQTARTTITVTRRGLMAGAIIVANRQGVKDSARSALGADLPIVVLDRLVLGLDFLLLTLGHAVRQVHTDRFSDFEPPALVDIVVFEERLCFVRTMR